MVRQLAVRAAGVGSAVGTLSGGNQQKVLLGRWLLAEPRILLLYDVTRGVDVATKHEIYQLMARLAGEGRAILFYSSDAEELAALCHRVLVMREGRIAAELRDRRPRSLPSRSSPPRSMSASRPEIAVRRGAQRTRAGRICWRRISGWSWQSRCWPPASSRIARVFYAQQQRLPGGFRDYFHSQQHHASGAGGIAQTLVVLTRGIDLSVGGMIDLTNAAAAVTLGPSPSAWCCGR